MKIGNVEFNKDNGYIMGILNVTPDSFSDGGKYIDVDAAVNQAKKMISDGASIIDIGGESTRPGANIVTEEEELKRVIPVIKALRAELDIPISIDTYKSNVAREAIKSGANLINDVWGAKRDPNIAKVAAEFNVPICLMHNRLDPKYNNFLKDVVGDLYESVKIAKEAGVKDENIMLDPGIGFAKTLEENLFLMNNLEVICNMGYEVLLGTSRKSMIGLALDLPKDKRVEGTIATTVMGAMKRCTYYRVHDVLENKRALDMTIRILRSSNNG